MSVIIKGMEMPKSCDECRLFNESWCMALGVENWRKSYNKPPEGGRLPDCPLVPLPEGHGRMGDLDALMPDFVKARWEFFSDGDTFLRLLKNAPTIVPAEGCKADD